MLCAWCAPCRVPLCPAQQLCPHTASLLPYFFLFKRRGIVTRGELAAHEGALHGHLAQI